MSWRESPTNEWYSTGTSQLSLKEHTANAIKAIDAEIDAVMNNPKKNAAYKAAAVKHWTDKKKHLTQISQADELTFQSKEERPPKTEH